LRVFEKRVLRLTFGPKRDKMTERWGKFHSKEDLMIRSRRMGWAGHVELMEI
jgi:hypothetical protein